MARRSFTLSEMIARKPSSWMVIRGVMATTATTPKASRSTALSLFVPPVYTAIAFDSGGVASGPMTSGFILPFVIGICVGAQGADAVLRDAFGVVALVAMAPLITIQLLGFKAIVSNHLKEKQAMKRILDADDMQIINFQ